MPDLLNFKRSHIVGARMAGASITKNTKLFGVAKITVSIVMTALEKQGKTFSLKQSDRDRRSLTWIVRKTHKNTAPKITAENTFPQKTQFPQKIVRRELHKAGFHRRAAIRKPY